MNIPKIDFVIRLIKCAIQRKFNICGWFLVIISRATRTLAALSVTIAPTLSTPILSKTFSISEAKNSPVW